MQMADPKTPAELRDEAIYAEAQQLFEAGEAFRIDFIDSKGDNRTLGCVSYEVPITTKRWIKYKAPDKP
jgi:hypothetical protein